MKRTILILLTLMILATLPLSADSDLLSYDELTSFLSKDDKVTLFTEGELTRFHFDSFDAQLLPPVTVSNDLKKKTEEQNLNMGIEGLFLYTEFDINAYNANPEKVKLELYNILRSVSSLEGTQYFSASRGEMRDLFVESWMIPDLKSAKTKLDDPIVSSIPLRDSILIHQKDKSFGKHESEMEFIFESPVIWSVIVNQSPMFYKGIFKVIKPEQMQIHLLAIPTDKGLLFYGISAADTLNVKSFRERANNSFYNRVKALYTWFTDSL